MTGGQPAVRTDGPDESRLYSLVLGAGVRDVAVVALGRFHVPVFEPLLQLPLGADLVRRQAVPGGHQRSQCVVVPPPGLRTDRAALHAVGEEREFGDRILVVTHRVSGLLSRAATHRRARSSVDMRRIVQAHR